jgi:nucleotide-binding universal stress UspA family protein
MARLLAARTAGAVVALSVVEPPAVLDFGGRRAMLTAWPIEHHLAQRRKAITDHLGQLDNLVAGPLPAVEVAFGSPAATIADVACDLQATLIVMGAGPYEPRQRLFAAGTALQTSRRANCPVLAVAEGAHALPRRAVVATDFTPASLHAALEALPLMADGAVLHLVHAWQRLSAPDEGNGLRALDDEYARSLPERFTRACTLLAPHDSRAIIGLAREGNPVDTVLGLARELGADLIVLGTRGLGTIARLVMGSVSTAIFRGSSCSVLLVPPPDAEHVARIERHMTGTSTTTEPAAWGKELESFARRNARRRTSLELDDRTLGAQVQQSGYLLTGATYDPHDHRIELMFEQPTMPDVHFTHTLGNVRSVGVKSGASGSDDVLSIESDEGTALLTFVSPLMTDPRMP